MSVVTNVLILADFAEELGDTEVCPAIDALNAKLAEFNKGAFVEVGKYAGGTKVMEHLVFAAAINHLDEKWFLECILGAPWLDQENIQVLICRQEQQYFSLFYGAKMEDDWYPR